MDEARIDALGAKPIESELDAVRAAEIARRLAAADGPRDGSISRARSFSLSTDVDLKDPKHYAVYLSQGGLGLPDRDYYLEPHFAAAKSGVSSLCRKIAAA